MQNTPPCHVALGDARKGFCGIIISVCKDQPGNDPAMAELERRLLEIGLVEGARVEILHEGLIGRDPIAVRVDDMRVALRRAEARAILVCPEAS